MRILQAPLGIGLDEPALSPLQIAFYRGLFGGAVMLALSLGLYAIYRRVNRRATGGNDVR